MTVEAKRVDDIDGPDVAPGSFEFFDTSERKDAGMLYACPCGCKRVGALYFRPHPSPAWQWDCNREHPTLSPSIHDQPKGKTHWHGHLKAGRWKSC